MSPPPRTPRRKPTQAPRPVTLGRTAVRSARRALRIERRGPAFGAIVHGVDLAALDEVQAFDARRALLTYKVLFCRGQDSFDDAGQVSLGNLLGDMMAGNPDKSDIYNINSSDPEFSFSDFWHTDVTFMKRPRPLASCAP